jgi:hypothetical protein
MRRDWRINPQERSLEPPDDDEPEDIDAQDVAKSRREDEEVESFMEGR